MVLGGVNRVEAVVRKYFMREETIFHKKIQNRNFPILLKCNC